jgi:TRAP-type C4-dicarboxylate transport system permease small subunit
VIDRKKCNFNNPRVTRVTAGTGSTSSHRQEGGTMHDNVKADEPVATDRPRRRPPMWRRAIDTSAMVLLVPAAVACALMLLQVVIDVTSRNVLGNPLKGTLDMTSDWWMVTAVFLGLGYAQSRNEHVRATMITELMPQAWQRAAEIAAVALLGLLALAMAYGGWISALDHYEIREASTSIRGLPLWPFRFLVPLGCLSLALQCIGTIYDVARASDRQVHESELV